MKIIVLHPHFSYPRGATKFALEVTERLSRRGWDCLVVTTKANPAVIKNYPHVKFHFLSGPITSQLSYWFTYPLFQIRLHKFLNNIPQKILFPQVMPANHWALIYKKFHPEVPLVWVCHEPSAFIHSPLVIESLPQPAKAFLKLTSPILGQLDRWLVKSADFIIANSSFTDGQIKKIYGKDADGIAYPSVDSQKFLPVSQKENFIFTISRLDKAKRINILISAFAKLPSKLEEAFPLLIGGEGKEKASLQKMVQRLGLGKLVKFLGMVPEKDLPGLYARARLVVFPAPNEPFGIVPLEAMASGTPVIAPRSGGVQETVIDGKTGLLVKPNDVSELCAKIIFVLSRPEYLAKMSKQARQHVEKNFSWEKTTAEVEKVLMKAETKVAKTTR